jgi:hypothetical protein
MQQRSIQVRRCSCCVAIIWTETIPENRETGVSVRHPEGARTPNPPRNGSSTHHMLRTSSRSTLPVRSRLPSKAVVEQQDSCSFRRSFCLRFWID